MIARVLLALVAIGCGAPERAPRVPLWPCAIAGVHEPLRCGTLSVPEDRAHAGGRHLALPIIVVPATRAGGMPLFELLGGPGAGATMVRVPALAHEPDIGTDCLLAIELAFLRAPLARVDASCVSGIRPLAG